ncbi:disease resistance protein RPM1-like [Pyrus x bretschneideri]|uniref:disease resistance protein RPM1-like n=1 Tax=Pyrus x bretschneideri TaxID=225117 RepID=UPI00202E946B|nr:disease resistance protein RPM1-like [Pyrus x bretschneideri]
MIVCIYVVQNSEISELNAEQKEQEEMASPPIGFLIGKIVSFVESKVSPLEGVHDELEDLRLELLTMKAFLSDAERKGEALSEVEKTWVANVRAFCRTVCFPKNLGERHRIATKLKRIIKRIRAIPERIGRFGVDHIEGVTFTNYDPNTRVKIYGESSLFFKDDLVGIKYEKEKLVEWLLCKQPQRSVISVVGMGGSGKTTLVVNTYKSQNLKKHFDCYAWIIVSQTYISVEDLLRTMIQELFRATMQAIPLDFSSMSYVHLVKVLVDYLEPECYLIVLDDVWDINLWRQINVALPNGTLGSRVMLTTRNEGIASFSFGVGSRVHHVQPLTDDDAWDLFSMKAFSSWDDSSCPTEFKLTAEDLVGKCQGLPLGIVALGALMSTKRFVPEWTKVYNSLNWELSNNRTLEVEKSILSLSFNDLSYQLKNCFLYFCIFPEDYVVQCKRLIRLSMAEGFVEQVRGAKPEDIAESYTAEVTCRCMLQVVKREPSGRAKTFKMHDLLRELALSISETEILYNLYGARRNK